MTSVELHPAFGWGTRRPSPPSIERVVSGQRASALDMGAAERAAERFDCFREQRDADGLRARVDENK